MLSTFKLGSKGLAFGFYVILGYAVRKDLFKSVGTITFFIGFISSLGITVLLQFILYIKGVTYNVFYGFIPLIICSLSLFNLIKRFPNNYSNESGISTSVKVFIREISLLSFGIYLLHYPFLLMLKNRIISMSCSSPFKVFLLCILSFIFSFITGWILSKWEGARKYLLFMK